MLRDARSHDLRLILLWFGSWKNGMSSYPPVWVKQDISRFPRAVIATPGGIVSDPKTFNLLLSHCYTVWLKASPEEHMGRVLARSLPFASTRGETRRLLDEAREATELLAAAEPLPVVEPVVPVLA